MSSYGYVANSTSLLGCRKNKTQSAYWILHRISWHGWVEPQQRIHSRSASTCCNSSWRNQGFVIESARNKIKTCWGADTYLRPYPIFLFWWSSSWYIFASPCKEPCLKPITSVRHGREEYFLTVLRTLRCLQQVQRFKNRSNLFIALLTIQFHISHIHSHIKSCDSVSRPVIFV